MKLTSREALQLFLDVGIWCLGKFFVGFYAYYRSIVLLLSVKNFLNKIICLINFFFLGLAPKFSLHHLLGQYQCIKEDDHHSYGEMGIPVPPFGCSFSTGKMVCHYVGLKVDFYDVISNFIFLLYYNTKPLWSMEKYKLSDL